MLFRNRIAPRNDPEFVNLINYFNIYRAQRFLYYPQNEDALIDKYLNESSEIFNEHLTY